MCPLRVLLMALLLLWAILLAFYAGILGGSDAADPLKMVTSSTSANATHEKEAKKFALVRKVLYYAGVAIVFVLHVELVTGGYISDRLGFTAATSAFQYLGDLYFTNGGSSPGPAVGTDAAACPYKGNGGSLPPGHKAVEA